MKPTDVADPNEVKKDLDIPDPSTANKIDNVTASFDVKLPIYALHYRRGNSPPKIKYFQYNGTITQAIVRARSYCERVSYRFCGTFPFLIDLDKEEKAYAEGSFLPD